MGLQRRCHGNSNSVPPPPEQAVAVGTATLFPPPRNGPSPWEQEEPPSGSGGDGAAPALLVRYEYGLPEQPPDQLKVFLKCLPVLVLIALILESQHGNDFSLRLVVAMGFAAAGDVCQLYKDQHFTHGVISFGIAYCLFAVAFGLKVDHKCLGALICVVATATYYLVTPGVQGVSQPVVLAYTLAVLLMIWRAMAWWRNTHHRSSLCAMYGAIILAISNVILSNHIFQFPVPHSPLLLSSCYYTGQLLIAMSSL
ncbi:lysoplasmalogenase-like protein TMEM86A [Pristis pectinata]|uniref:lysoplasmalogenase-like protein TMEM86A n=1 Tax=Pristis pectinata TaxID=685728 RepID=UPI00223D22A2|nr:lysoplasmalogenase-like protein TMEM86A [Pristis pectinata]